MESGYRVKAHNLGWVTHKWENNYNCSDSPQGVRGLSPTSGSPAWRGRRGPRRFGIQGQRGLLSTEKCGKERLHSERACTKSHMLWDPEQEQ